MNASATEPTMGMRAMKKVQPKRRPQRLKPLSRW